MDQQTSTSEPSKKLQQDFLNQLSHDLRNSLNVVLMATEMMERKESPSPEFVKQQSSKIKTAAHQMASFIEEAFNELGIPKESKN